MNETEPIYLGEMRLLRWGHSDSSGRTVTFELPTDEPRHPFEGYSTGREYGQRMKVVCVALDDHEQPLAPEDARRKKKSKKAPGSSNGRTPDFDSGNGGSSPSPGTKSRTQFAGMWIKDWQFQHWLGVHPQVEKEDRVAHADNLLKAKLGIASKKELDSDPSKGAAWDALWTDYQVRDLVRS